MNCVSVVVIWDRVDFHRLGKWRGGRDELKRIILSISDCVKRISRCEPHGPVKFESESTLDGNQARKDLGFMTEDQAKDFVSIVEKTIPSKLSSKVSLKTFLYSECQLGCKEEPVLTEQDILNLLLTSRTGNLFRHFLTCTVVIQDKIMFKFNTMSDVNLFLFNRFNSEIDSGKGTLGFFRKNQKQMRLLTDKDGKFNLIAFKDSKCTMIVPFKENPKCQDMKGEWRKWEEKYNFKCSKLAGGVMRLQFEKKAELYTFFSSGDAKTCSSLRVPKEQLYVEAKNNNLESLVKYEDDSDKLMTNILAAKEIELAKLQSLIKKQNQVIKELRKELECKSKSCLSDDALNGLTQLHSKLLVIPSGRPALEKRLPRQRLAASSLVRKIGRQKTRLEVLVTQVQMGGLVTGQLETEAARETLQFLSCKLPAAEMLMDGVERVEDLDHTLLYGTKVKEELVRCQTQLTNNPVTNDCIPVSVIDWGTSTEVTLRSLFHLPLELAALQPGTACFRLKGWDEAGVRDMEDLMGKLVEMVEVDIGIFECLWKGQVVNY